MSTDRLLGKLRTRTAAATCATLLLLGGVSLVPGGPAPAGASLPPVEPLAAVEPVIEDGFNHFVVEVAPDGAASAATITAVLAHPEVEDAQPSSGAFWAVRTTLEAEPFTAVAIDAGAVSVAEDTVLVTYSNDTYSPHLWGLENTGQAFISGAVADVDTDGVEARAAVAGHGVVVAVIDSGIEPDQEDMRPLWRNAGENCTNGVDDDANGFVDDCNGWDFYNNDNTPYDTGAGNHHGTHVATTIAAIPDNGKGTAGLAPGVTIMGVKALQNGSMWTTMGASAIRYAVDNGADVINASWGTARGATLGGITALTDAVAYAESKGVTIVAAAGNDGTNLDIDPHWPASYGHSNVITVGSHMASGATSGFSNYSATQVDLFAPGSYIVAAVDGGSGPGQYRVMQGTSMAAPHVAAAAALVVAQNPTATHQQVRAALLSSVDAAPALVNRSATGGRLNAARALGLNPDAGDPLTVTVRGADELAPGEAGELGVTAVVVDPAVASGRDVVLRASLLTNVAGEAYAVTDLPVVVDGVEQRTDERASIPLSDAVSASSPSLTGGLQATLGLALPTGTYALAFELVDAADAAVAYGPAATVFLTIGDPSTLPAPTTTPAPTTPTTVRPPTPTTVRPPTPTTPTTVRLPATTTTVRPSTPTTKVPAGTTPTTKAPTPSTPTTRPSGGTTPTTARPTTPTTRPGSGGTTATTVKPSTTSTTRPSSGGTTPTTARPTTTTVKPAPTPTPTTTSPSTPKPPVTNDGMTISSVTPSAGPATGGTTVAVYGSGFTPYARVLFGGRAGTITSRSGTRLLATTPSSTSGTVAVQVADHSGHQVTMPNAYTFTGTAGNPTPTTAAPTPAPTPTPTTAKPAATTTTVKATTPTTRAPAPTTTATPTTSTTAPRPASAGRDRLAGGGAPLLRNGLTLVRVTGSPVSAPAGSWATLSCRTPTCAGSISR